MKEDGTTEWIFESLEDMSEINSADYKLFWIGLYGTPLIWIGLLILALLKFKFQVRLPVDRGVMDENGEPQLRGLLDVVAPQWTCALVDVGLMKMSTLPRGVCRESSMNAPRDSLVHTLEFQFGPQTVSASRSSLANVKPALLTAPPPFPAARSRDA